MPALVAKVDAQVVKGSVPTESRLAPPSAELNKPRQLGKIRWGRFVKNLNRKGRTSQDPWWPHSPHTPSRSPPSKAQAIELSVHVPALLAPVPPCSSPAHAHHSLTSCPTFSQCQPSNLCSSGACSQRFMYERKTWRRKTCLVRVSLSAL